MGSRGRSSGAARGTPPGAATPENPGKVRPDEFADAARDGYMFPDPARPAYREALPPAKNAPKFPLENAERGILVQVDGDPNRLASVWAARADGNSKQAMVSSAYRDSNGRRYFGLPYRIDRNRMKIVRGTDGKPVDSLPGGRRGSPARVAMENWRAGKTDKLPGT